MTKAATKRTVVPESDSDVSICGDMHTAKAVEVAKKNIAQLAKKPKLAETACAKGGNTMTCPHCKKSFNASSKAAEMSSDEETEAPSSARVTPVASVSVKASIAKPVMETSTSDSESDEDLVAPVFNKGMTKSAPAKAAPVKAPVKAVQADTSSSSSSSESSEDEAPVMAKGKVAAKAAPVAAKKQAVVESSESESSSDEEIVAKPTKKAEAKKVVAPVESSESESEAADSEDEPVATPQPKKQFDKKPVSASTPAPVSEESSGEQAATGRPEGCVSVFIGNLPFTATDEDLQWMFKECGEIRNARIATDRETGKPRGFGYVDFVSGESVDLAMKKNGEDMNGRQIRIDYSLPKNNNGPRPGGFGGQGGNRGGFGGNREGGFGGNRGGFGGNREGGFGGNRGGFGGNRSGPGGFNRGGGRPPRQDSFAAASKKGSVGSFAGQKTSFADDE